MKRNIIEKYQRLAHLQEQYGEQIEALAQKQLGIYRTIIREAKLEDTYENSFYMRHNFLKVHEDGSVGLWQHGRCGDGDEQIGTISIHPLIMANDLEGYEQHVRDLTKIQAEQVIKARQAETQRRKDSLQAEMNRISNELGKLSS